MTGVHAEGSPDEPGVAGDDDDRQPCGADTRLSDFYSDGLEACGAPTTDGDPCRRPVVRGVGRCEVHLPEDGFADGTH
jgi:hypothetical protein